MSRFARTIVIAAVLGVLVIPARLAAAQATPRYTLIDLGTFGGPTSYFLNGFDGILNNQGTAVG
jgi:hypothetical protein